MARELEDEVDVLTRKEVKEFHIEQEADVKQKEIEDIKELIIDKCNNFLERH